MKTMIFKALGLLIVGLSSQILVAQTAGLTIEVKGIKEIRGTILVSVKSYDDPQQIQEKDNKLIIKLVNVKELMGL